MGARSVRSGSGSCTRAFVTLLAFGAAPLRGAGDEPFAASTRIAISEGAWELNGRRTYAGTQAEGLLLNVRMVQATFEDRNAATCPRGFDADRNTSDFIARIPEYAEQGVRAFTLNLQGGRPGYKGALNSAFDPDGTLRPGSMKRVARVVEACDRAHVAVILGCFYQEQDQVLKDAAAIRNAVTNAAAWVRERGYRNVLIEIANEHPHDGFDHEILRSPAGMAELIELARRTAPDLLVSASGAGGGDLHARVQQAASFVLIHFNNTPLGEIPDRVAAARAARKPIVCNEDDKTGKDGAAALEAACRARCSWGYMNKERNQFFPFRFGGREDDPTVYDAMKALTTPHR